MTVAFNSGRTRRAGAALAAASAGLLVLSACDKPTPLATVTVGTNSVNTEASCRGEDGKPLAESKLTGCLSGVKDAKSIDYAPGSTLRLGVDPKVVENGSKWIALLDGSPITEASAQTYRSFPNADVFASGQGGAAPKEKKVSIVQVDKDNKPESVWSFTLKRTNS
ncbi:DUF2771 domain-containing protein [Streptomyces xanthochromogenes]|uniref:Lipoprotein n=1 Tax=Streptomyces xanthochromogenes TaxID=67384 RepID=A0ABQ3ALI4_9ACTN|nr:MULTISPECIES: DUF2771 domain-containing protein [Streptomyces]MYV95806.1 DUF2771 domain-containing protein [Streptomyces sp. SID1034]GGY56533.1 lipoprotein [Streptomyces xanthochromogenes]